MSAEALPAVLLLDTVGRSATGLACHVLRLIAAKSLLCWAWLAAWAASQSTKRGSVRFALRPYLAACAVYPARGPTCILP